jgi:hypothetical protein
MERTVKKPPNSALVLAVGLRPHAAQAHVRKTYGEELLYDDAAFTVDRFVCVSLAR